MRRFAPIGLLLLLAILAALVLWRTWPAPAPPEAERLSVAETLGGAAAEGYARATEARPFVFPVDHGPHPDFRTEWWYFTGNLEDARGRHFGYQLTFFRVALAAQMPERASNWATRQVYMAHFALTDPAGSRFYDWERFSRAALGLAGAQAEPFRVWLEDWSVIGKGEGANIFPLRLRAAAGEVAIDLLLAQGKPIVLQGERGLSRKSGEAGNASYYYSLTRMPTTGVVRLGKEEYAVRGASWLDREWSTSALGAQETGWDWLALQLSDGRELMFYRLRRQDGRSSPFSAGTLVEPDGTFRVLSPGEVEIRELDHWQSPASGALYPALWRLRVPDAGIDLEIVPWLADQELDATVRYWEGAVRIRGESAGMVVSGNGYIEMTGYGKADEK
ncbi:MAG: lipocalin-like domain-containing protein [Desulfuromonadales bacterium]|jgi:predicted secreted hydrolase